MQMRIAVLGISNDLARAQASAGKIPLLDLDLANGDPLCCVNRYSAIGDRAGFEFVGSLYPERDPLNYLRAVFRSRRKAGESFVANLPSFRGTPLGSHVLRMALDEIQPDIVITSEDQIVDRLLQNRQCGIEFAEKPPSKDSRTLSAWRKAVWRTFLSECKEIDLSLAEITFVNARLGSGREVPPTQLDGLELDAMYAEVGDSLYVVASADAETSEVFNAASRVGKEHAQLVDPKAFRGIVCGARNSSGEDVALARIKEIDFMRRIVRLQTPSPEPIPATQIVLGRLVVDEEGIEYGHLKPWQV